MHDLRSLHSMVTQYQITLEDSKRMVTQYYITPVYEQAIVTQYEIIQEDDKIFRDPIQKDEQVMVT